MTLSQVASSSLILVLALAGMASAERETLKVPVAAAPKFDGTLTDAAWDKGVSFELLREDERFGSVRLLRVGRTLFVGYHSEFKPQGLGIRFNFMDPATGRSVGVLIAPMGLPRSPLSAWLTRRADDVSRLDASGSQLRFDFSPETGFTFNASLPLDLLEIGRPHKRFQFNAELWDTDANRPLALYPSPIAGGGQQPFADLEPTKDWGVDVPVSESEPVTNGALALLEEIAKPNVKAADEAGSRGGDAITAYTGFSDGKRSDAPLAKLEVRLREQIQLHPDYGALYANLARVLVGRNNPAGALAVLREMQKQLPDVGRDPRQVLVLAQLLRDSGRYEEARKWLASYAKFMNKDPGFQRETAQVTAILDAWEAEQGYRVEEEKRDDLPRVRIETNRGAFVVELFEDDAPNTVANFLRLVARDFYNGTRFHWAAAAGSVVGGDPNSRDKDRYNDGFGGPGYLIEPEQNKRSNFPFTLVMVPLRRSDWTMGSAFAVNLSPAPDQDGHVTVFGRVIDGFDVVRRLAYYDTLKKATVVRKRDHAYEVVERPKR